MRLAERKRGGTGGGCAGAGRRSLRRRGGVGEGGEDREDVVEGEGRRRGMCASLSCTVLHDKVRIQTPPASSPSRSSSTFHPLPTSSRLFPHSPLAFITATSVSFSAGPISHLHVIQSHIITVNVDHCGIYALFLATRSASSVRSSQLCKYPAPGARLGARGIWLMAEQALHQHPPLHLSQ